MSSEIQSLQACLASLPDPRKKRGVRFPFASMLLLALVGLLSRQTTLQAIVDHARLHWDTLAPAMGFASAFGAPHATTLSRLLARIAPEVLQAAIARWLVHLVGDMVEEASVDGKYPHQARAADGARFGMLNVFAHEIKACLWQWVVSDKSAEPTVLKAHLAELFAAYPHLRILTGDALFAQRELCEALVEARRGYLWRLKGNQPRVQAALVQTFAEAPQRAPDVQEIEKRRGEIVTRQLWVDEETAGYVAQELAFAGAQQVARLDKSTRNPTTGKEKKETWYLVSFDPHGPVSAADLLHRARAHWGVENSLHHVEDRSWDEDRHTLRRPGLGVCFSMLLSLALTVLHLSEAFDADLSLPRRAKQCEAQPLFALNLLAN